MGKNAILTAFVVMFTVGTIDIYGFGGTTDYYDASGGRIGSAHQAFVGDTDYYNASGSRIGSARQRFGGNIDYYDASGSRIGSSRN